MSSLFTSLVTYPDLTSALYYKQVLHSHMSVKLHFCVIILKFTAKCLFLRIFDREGAH
jgi:hypothetical protein